MEMQPTAVATADDGQEGRCPIDNRSSPHHSFQRYGGMDQQCHQKVLSYFVFIPL
jgi:hypothetical protein